MKIEKNFYGRLKNGTDVHSFTITNDSGAYIELIDYGATLNKIVVPDKNGKMLDVLVGFDTVEGQELCTDSQGRTVGRVANRIAGKGITIDGKNYQITKNVDGKFTLHSNHEYETVVWNSEIIGDSKVVFTYHSPDGAEGFPGEVDNEVEFSFTEDNTVFIEYSCTPTEKCPLNVTNHAYFNLNGFDGGQIVDHEVQLFCDAYTPTDWDAIPTGEIRDVTGTAFDFRKPKKIGRDVTEKDEQLIIGRGYDHNFAISGYDGEECKKFAVVRSEQSGITMEAFTDLPGVQFYIGNFMKGTQIGKAGKPLEYRSGFCLETQYFPDAANHEEFISNIFTPDKPFSSITAYRFSK
jgi:aldose 1-epimerase